MKTEEIIIANLKCSGCATTIKNNLMELPGIQDVNVVNDEDKVIVSYDNLDRSAITEKLHSLGYPEATEENGLLLQLKSFASCMVGRVNDMTNK
jgi:copper chaperone CopZ